MGAKQDMVEITNTEATIDVRDVIARAEFLESGDDVDQDAESEDQQELATLIDLLTNLKGNGGDEQWKGDWYPLTLIRDNYFKEFAQEEAEGIGLITSNTQWPFTFIDWKAAAEALQMDYNEVDFGGATYWYR